MADPTGLLRAEVAGLQAYIEEVEDRLDDEVGQIQSRVAVLEVGPARAANTTQPWAASATAQEWHELAAWVDWLNESYELPTGSRIPPCWPAHAGASEQLAALWHAWIAARAAQVADISEHMIAWHERWLWGALPHIVPVMKECENNGHRIRPAPDPTDLNAGLLPTDTTAG